MNPGEWEERDRSEEWDRSEKVGEFEVSNKIYPLLSWRTYEVPASALC